MAPANVPILEFTHDTGVIIVLAARPQLKNTFCMSLTNKGFNSTTGPSDANNIRYSEPYYLQKHVEYTESATEGRKPVQRRIACVQLLSLTEFSSSNPSVNVDIFADLCALLATLSMRSQPFLGFLYLGESKIPRIGGAAGTLIEQLAKYIIGRGRSQFAFVSVSWLDRGVREAVLANNEEKIHSWLDRTFRGAGSSSEAGSLQNLQMLKLTRDVGSPTNIILAFVSNPTSFSSKPLLQDQLPNKAKLSDTSIGQEFGGKLGSILRDLCDDLLEDKERKDLFPEHLDTVFQHHSGFLELHAYDKVRKSPEWSAVKTALADIVKDASFILLFDRDSTLISEPQKLKPHFPLIPAGNSTYFILVPTFQNTPGDALIFAQVYRCLAFINTFNLQLLGITYCWPDSSPRIKVEVYCNLKLLSKICGTGSLDHLVLLKSTWQSVDQNTGVLKTLVPGANFLAKNRHNHDALKAAIIQALQAATAQDLPDHKQTGFDFKSETALCQEIKGNNSISGTSAGVEVLQFLTKELAEKEDDLKVYDASNSNAESLHRIWYSQITMLFFQWGIIRFSGSASIYQNIEAELEKDANVQKAILRMEAILSVHSKSQSGHRLAQLGGLYSAQFAAHGDSTDLSNTIKRYNEAVASLDPDSPKRAEYLLTLGSHLEKKCQLFGQKDDLVNAILVCQEAADMLAKSLDSSLPSNLRKALAAHAVAAMLKRKFEDDMDNTGVDKSDVNDIDKAILYLHNAEGLVPHGHQAASIIFSDLCHSHVLKSKYHSYKNEDQQAISTIETAMDEYNKTLPEPGPTHPAYAMILDAKCQAYSKHYKLVKVKSLASKYADDIQEAIRAGEMAVSHSHKEGTSQECRYLLNLGKAYWYLHESSSEVSSTGSTVVEESSPLAKAIECFFQSVLCKIGDHMTRFKSARNWAKVETKKAIITKLRASESDMALKAYECCIVLLAQIAGEEIPLYEQHRRLEKIQKIVYQATAAAINCGKLDKAVEFFEEGRSVIWKHYFKHDIIMQALKDKDPKLAKEWSNHQTQLRSNEKDEANSNLKMRAIILGEEASQSPASSFIMKGLKKIGSAIKQIAGFASFGFYQDLSLLDKATEHGSIILINLYDKQCDALILQKQKPITHVRLPKMTSRSAAELQENLKEVIGFRAGSRGIKPAKQALNKGKKTMEAILKTLWVDIADPVVKSLDQASTPAYSHIFWCMSGPLAFLPLHAAGDYTIKGQTIRLADFFHSSYTPNIFSLLRSSTSTSSNKAKFQLLAIAQSKTPSEQGGNLPKTLEEVGYLQKHKVATIHTTVLINEEGTVARVKQELVKSQWAHFACHGVQDPVDGLKSALILHEGKGLTLKELVELKITHAELAFLSACQTAKGDHTLPEEHIHLAAGMLTAGYQGVIATMWSIDDEDGVDVAKWVYEILFKDTTAPGWRSTGLERLDSKNAVKALDEAVEKLRKKVPTDDYARWVPFVHIGL